MKAFVALLVLVVIAYEVPRASAVCAPVPAACATNTDCCSGQCGANGLCACAHPTTGTCVSPSDCCSGNCVNGFCACAGLMGPCTQIVDCCPGLFGLPALACLNNPLNLQLTVCLLPPLL